MSQDAFRPVVSLPLISGEGGYSDLHVHCIHVCGYSDKGGVEW